MNKHHEAAAHSAYADKLRTAIQYGTEVDGPWCPTSPAWEAMMDKGGEHRWPTHYRDDLVLWDRQSMHEDPRPCIWGLRERGTHITRVPETLKAIHGTFGDGIIWHHWDGNALTPVTYEEAQELAAGWPQ